MTVAPQVPALSSTRRPKRSGAARAGLRLSTARRLVLEALFAADGPVAAVYLADTLVDRRVVGLPQPRGARESRSDPPCPPRSRTRPLRPARRRRGRIPLLRTMRKGHPGRARRLEPVRDRSGRTFGYETRFTHFAIVGRCADCAADEGIPPRAEMGQLGSSPKTIDISNSPGSETPDTHDHAHSHGDYVHSHPHPYAGRGARPLTTERTFGLGPRDRWSAQCACPWAPSSPSSSNIERGCGSRHRASVCSWFT